MLCPTTHLPVLHRYWNDPDVLSKLGKAMGGAMDLPQTEEGEEEEEVAEVATLHSTASAGGYPAACLAQACMHEYKCRLVMLFRGCGHGC